LNLRPLGPEPAGISTEPPKSKGKRPRIGVVAPPVAPASRTRFPPALRLPLRPPLLICSPCSLSWPRCRQTSELRSPGCWRRHLLLHRPIRGSRSPGPRAEWLIVYRNCRHTLAPWRYRGSPKPQVPHEVRKTPAQNPVLDSTKWNGGSCSAWSFRWRAASRSAKLSVLVPNEKRPTLP
jgi:hypothetical protein